MFKTNKLRTACFHLKEEFERIQQKRMELREQAEQPES